MPLLSILGLLHFPTMQDRNENPTVRWDFRYRATISAKAIRG